MQKISETFSVRLSNIPLINLREDFKEHYFAMKSTWFRRQFVGEIKWPIKSPNILWNTMPNGLLTLILQRAVVGVESWMYGAVFSELGRRGMLNEETLKYLRSPSKLGGRSMANSIYNKMPGLVSDQHPMTVSDHKLYMRVLAFYKEVRNPIMHGFEVDSKTYDGVLSCFDLMYEIHCWTDSWFSFESIIPPNSDNETG